MKKIFFTIIILSVFLAACGGGGGGSGGGSADENPNTVSQSPEGIWIGSFTSSIERRTYKVIGIITESGIARFAATSTLAQYSAVLKVSGDKITTTAIVYLPSGSYAGKVDIVASFSPKGFMNGTYSGPIDRGAFSLAYSSLYERPSSLSAIAGNWTDYSSGYYQTITVDMSGNINGEDISGCSYSGKVNIINSSKNVYDFNLVIKNCGVQSGTYSGLAALTDTEASNDTLLASASMSTYSFVAELRR